MKRYHGLEGFISVELTEEHRDSRTVGGKSRAGKFVCSAIQFIFDSALCHYVYLKHNM